MADEPKGAKPKDAAQGGNPASSAHGADEPAADFETFLKSQSEETRTMFAARIKNLESAHGKAKEEKQALKAELEKVRQAQADAEAEKAKAAEKALAEQKQYEQLAEKRGARLDEIEPKLKAIEAQAGTHKERAEKAEATLKGYLDAERAALKLDAATLELLDTLDVMGQLAWLTKHKATIAGKQPAPFNGVPGARPPTGNEKVTIDEILKNAPPVW